MLDENKIQITKSKHFWRVRGLCGRGGLRGGGWDSCAPQCGGQTDAAHGRRPRCCCRMNANETNSQPNKPKEVCVLHFPGIR